MHSPKLLLLLGTILFCFHLEAQNIIYISADTTIVNGDGSRDNPSTIENAFNNLAYDGAHFRLDTGRYEIDAPLLINHDNMIIEGGFHYRNNWVKSSDAKQTRIYRNTDNVEGSFQTLRLTALSATNKSGFHIQNLTVEVADAPAALTYGISTYGVYLNGCSDYDILRVHSIVGKASDGADGVDGANGLNGANGMDRMLAGPWRGGDGADGAASTPGQSASGGEGGNQAFPGTAESIDQSQLNLNSTIGTYNIWQSFTPSIDGLFSKLELYFRESVESTVAFKIREGEGLSGAILYEADVPVDVASFQDHTILIHDKIHLTQGEKYTFSVDHVEIQWNTTNPYAGGTADGGGNSDYKFRTYMMGEAEYGEDRTIVPFASYEIIASNSTQESGSGQNSSWQSFTALKDGYLGRFKANSTSFASQNVTLNIYEGEGTGGNLLATDSYSFATGGWYTMFLTSWPTVQAGQKYTAEMVGYAWEHDGLNNSYSGGRSKEDANIDLLFIAEIENGIYRSGAPGGGGGGRTNNDLNTSAGNGGTGGRVALNGTNALGGYGRYPYQPGSVDPSEYNGANGVHGVDGVAVFPPADGQLLDLYYNGVKHDGFDGQGGNGGAGGGGARDNSSGSQLGLSGGGGGAGGEGGQGGEGGYGGGSGFGFYIVNNGVNAKLRDYLVSTNGAGAGGSAGQGGTGGTGGQGGKGDEPGIIGFWDSGDGGNGGNGGDGTNGVIGDDGLTIDVHLSGDALAEDNVNYFAFFDYGEIRIEEPRYTFVPYTIQSPGHGNWDIDNDGNVDLTNTLFFQHHFENTGYKTTNFEGSVYKDFIYLPSTRSCPSGPILYVNQNVTGGDSTGSSWTNAMPNLQDAIDYAHVCSGITDIYVAKGVYRPERMTRLNSAAYACFRFTKDINFVGGFVGGENTPADRSMLNGKLDPANYAILNGDLQQNDIDPDGDGIINRSNDIVALDSIADNVYHVVLIEEATENMVVDGFVITGGYSNSSFDDIYGTVGGGLMNIGFSSSSNPQLSNLHFRGNVAAQTGGAIVNVGNTQPTITNCDFLYNASYENGGAIYNMANDDLVNQLFFIYGLTGSNYIHSSQILNSRFAGNLALNNGGAIYNDGSGPGNIYSKIIQCVFSGNNASVSSAIATIGFGNEESGVTILNSLFAGNNSFVFESSAATIKIYNSIIYGNGFANDGSQFIGNGYDIQNCLVSGVLPDGTSSNIYNFDPEFVDPVLLTQPTPNVLGDYRLSACSPAIDKGNNQLWTDSTAITIDYDLNPRFIEGPISTESNTPVDYIDLGPFETPGPIQLTATKDINDAFIDLNWSVDKTICNCLEEDPIFKQGVLVSLKSEGEVIDSWTVFEENIEQIYAFSYRDYVGPNVSKPYTLEFNRIGPGTLNCRNIDLGSTLPFTSAELLHIDNYSGPDTVFIQWRNHSSLTNKFNIYRGGDLIGTINATNELGKVYHLTDQYSFEGASLVNGETYDYCIETVSEIVQNLSLPALPQTCGQGSTYPIDLQASDDLYTDKVTLTWNDVSPYCEQIAIKRNNVLLNVVDSDQTTYDDVLPIYGLNANYSIELILNEGPIAASDDLGSAPANGQISGKVISSIDKFPIQGVRILLQWSDENGMHIDSAFTDYAGLYGFADLYYGESNEFTLSASYPNATFEEGQRSTLLDLSQPAQFDITFFMNSEFEKSETPLNVVTNFVVTADATADQVMVEWNADVISGDTTYFNLYRGSELVFQVDDASFAPGNQLYYYFDLGGVPDSNYTYTLQAFQFEESTVVDSAFSQIQIFPSVTPPNSFAHTINPLGFVDFSWLHTSTNFDGFRLYRIHQNDELVYEGKNLLFDDLSGRPDSVTSYFIRSYRTVDGIDYESTSLDTIQLTYPGLTSIAVLHSIPAMDEDIVRVEMLIPAIYDLSYNYSGVKLYRASSSDTVLVKTIDKNVIAGGQVIEITDRNGAPNIDYTYEAKPYLVSNNVSYEKEGFQHTVTFPAVSVPQNLTSNSLIGKIELNWDTPHSSRNYDGFYIYKGDIPNIELLDSIAFDWHNIFTEYRNFSPTDVAENYHVATFRRFQDTIYISQFASTLVSPPIMDGDEPEEITNVTATKDQSDHVKVCWQWNEPSDLTPFVIRREGVVLDTVPTGSSAYFDYTAPVGVDVEYSIETPGVNGQNNYQWVYVSGMRPSNWTLYGRAYKADTKIGIPNTRILTIISDIGSSGPRFQATTYTDESGYYQFNNVPYPINVGTFYSLGAFNENSDFENNGSFNQTFYPSDEQPIEVDFIDLAPSNYDSMGIAQILNASAVPDASNMAIRISWSPSNNDYTGFEIYRGTELLGEVLKGQALIWTDQEGFPGVPGLYSIRAFQVGQMDRTYSDYAYTSAIFPDLTPPENLNVSVIPGENKLLIQWGHLYNNHDFYTITRNGIPFHIVSTDETLQAIDSTGVPSEFYNYEVVAYQGIVQSLGVSESAQYPAPKEITGFDISVPADIFSSFNHILLEWAYEDFAADSFLILRTERSGNGTIIDKSIILERVSGNVREIRDFTGVPEREYYYEIVPVIVREGVEYIAKRRSSWSEKETFPTLAEPLMGDPNGEDGIISIFYRYLYDGADGFRIDRDGELLEEISNTQFGLGVGGIFGPILDRDGTPMQSYTYTLYAYTVREGVTYLSEPASKILPSYPRPPIPENFQATDGEFPNKIALTWDYSLEYPVDEFKIERNVNENGWAELATVNAGERTYDDFAGFNVPPEGFINIDYRIYAKSKSIGSDATEDAGYINSIGSANFGGEEGIFLGWDIDISEDGNWAVAGTSGKGIYIYKLLNNNVWKLHDRFTETDMALTKGDGFGTVVSISGDYIVAAAPDYGQDRGRVYVFERNASDEWKNTAILNRAEEGVLGFGSNLDVYDDPNLGGKDRIAIYDAQQLTVYKKNATAWVGEFYYPKALFQEGFSHITMYGDNIFASSFAGTIFQIDLISDTPYLVFDPGEGRTKLTLWEDKLLTHNKNRTRIWTVAGNEIVLDQLLSNDNANLFGGAGVYGDHIAFASERDGDIKKFVRVGAQWDEDVPVLDEFPNITSELFGNSVKLSNKFIMISASLSDVFEENGGRVQFVPINNVPPPTNVQATDGTQPGQVTITWDLPVEEGLFDGYKVFRDGEFLTHLSNSQGRIFIDLPSAGLVPGRINNYQVVSVIGNISSVTIADQGHMPPNGRITGTVKTLIGSAPIEDAEITANVFVDGDYLTYDATTNAIGQYVLDDIYYGEDTIVRVTCTYLDHEIVTEESIAANPPLDTIAVNLMVTNNVNTNANFLDKTAFAITGNVRHEDIANCFLDSIKLTRTYRILLQGNEIIQEEDKYTDADGNYAFIIDPETAGLQEILIDIDDSEVIGGDTLSDFYKFEMESTNNLVSANPATTGASITDFNLGLNTIIDFADQTRYDATVKILNTCGVPLGMPEDEWTVRVDSRDGCYTKNETIANGTANFPVPPLDLIFTVIDVNNKTTQNLVVLDYLINTPSALNVYEVHSDTMTASLSQQELFEKLTIKLEYHRPSNVIIDMSTFDFMCDDQNREAIIQAGTDYKIPVSVSEFFDSGICDVTSGFLRIVNGASSNSGADTIYYNTDEMAFPDYTFTAGAPNPVEPHAWNLSVEYFNPAGIFQGVSNRPIIVEGAVTLPGNGVITDASNEDEEVPLPLFVLRDPPGDQSFSSISTGHEVSKTFTFDETFGGYGSVYANTDFDFAGIGFEATFNEEIGGYNSDTRELTISTLLTEEISTDPGLSENGDSRGSSVIVGAGFVMQYGIVNSYSVTGCDEITVNRRQGFTPIKLQTTWTYTVQFIEDLIAGYTRDLELIEAGLLTIDEDDGTVLPKEEALGRYTALKKNWEQVLVYFDQETNPIYYLTETDFEDELRFGTLDLLGQSSLNREANKWRDALRDLLDEDGNGHADLDVILNQEKLDKYNNAATAIRELLAYKYLEDDAVSDIEYIPQLIEAFDLWHFTEARFNEPNFAADYPNIGNNEMAENRTFGGLTTQTFSYEQTTSSAKTTNINIYSNTTAGLEASIGTDVTTFIGLGGGIIKKVVETDAEVGGVASFQYSHDESVTEGATVSAGVSYTLSDDDPFDEISVSVLKSVDLSQTPFFQMIGGKTTCPHEDGTLEKDNPAIQVLNPQSGVAGKAANLFFQDPDMPAEFTIKIANLSATLDEQDIEVFLDNNSNPNGATIRLGGAVIGSQVYTNLPYNNPLTLTLTVDRAFAYDYSGLRIGVRPACEDGNKEDFIELNVKFQSPCSPVSIVQPDDNWLINGVSRELIIGIQDYIPSTPNFEGITLQYRKLGGSTVGFESGWKDIPYTSIKETGDKNNPVLSSELEAYNLANFSPGQTPKYFMVWEPDMGNSSLFSDGDYELRVVAECKEGNILNFTYSNVIKGTIDRSRLQLFGVPQPSDGVWVPGDLISAEFNKNIDCTRFNDDDYLEENFKAYVKNEEWDEVPEANFICFNNEIRIVIPLFLMESFDGKMMKISMDNITDPNGNFATEINGDGTLIEWEFLITTSKAYWEQDSIIVELYEGESLTLTAGLRNTEFQTSLTGLMIDRSTASDTWLVIDPDPMNTFSVNPGAVKPIILTFEGLVEGVTYDTLSISGLPGTGASPRLPIKLVTTKRPPYPPDWEVDGNLYPNSMTMVTNYKIGDGDLSTDTLDQVSAWIDNTLRGLGRIQKVSEDIYVSYLTIYGNNLDENAEIEFRVWNADTDVEYNAYPEQESVIYQTNTFVGSAGSPRILLVDESKDRARYIHLNEGFTWISMNTVEEDMSVNQVLRNLKNVTPGDRILGQDGFSEYIDETIGWFSDPNVSTYMDTIFTDKSYMVFLESGPDSIRVTGVNAEPFTKFFLQAGTQWVGFPSQVPLTVEEAINTSDNTLSNITELRNKDLARASDGADWTAGLLTEMVPNDGYQLTLAGPKSITIPGVVPMGGIAGPAFSLLRASMAPATPDDPSTWILNQSDYRFKDVTPLIGRLLIDGVPITGDSNKKFAVFINGELRGVSTLNHINQLSDNLFTLLIGREDIDNGYPIKIYYADSMQVNGSVTLEVSEIINGGAGGFTYLEPFVMDLDPCADDIILDSDNSPLDRDFYARNSITLTSNLFIEAGKTIELHAPEIIIDGFVHGQNGSFILVKNEGCN